MDIAGISAVVTGGSSGLGLTTARRLVEGGAQSVLLDLAASRAADAAEERGPLGAVVQCTGRRHTMRVQQKAGSPR